MDFGEEIGVKKSSAQITDHIRFESIYEQDRLIPVLPDSTLSMESAALEKIRQSYACMSFCMEQSGFGANQELAGRDRPETVEKTYADLKKWLA